MSEIEKMYELAGIENYSIKGWTGFVPNKYKIIADDDDNVIDIVLDFTAEKQLSLIKWLGIRDEFNFYQNKVTKDWVFYDHEKDATHYNFELGLAKRKKKYTVAEIITATQGQYGNETFKEFFNG